MKIQKIGALCRLCGDVLVVNQRDEDGQITQWVGTHNALYPLHGVPQLDQAALYAVLGISEKQKESTAYSEHEAEEVDWFVGELNGSEPHVCEEPYQLVISGKTYTPVDTSKGIRLINRQFITPVATKEDDLLLFERVTKTGEIYFAIRSGLFITASILPATVSKAASKMFAKLSDRSAYAIGAEDAVMLVNAETGEIMEKGGHVHA